MTMIDPGQLGAKRQSWRQGNPRELLKRIIDDLGTLDRMKLLSELSDQVFQPENRPVLESIVEYWFSNNYDSLVVHVPSDREQAGAERRQRTAKVSKEIVERMTVAAGKMLLDLVLPHGKALKDSTGTECLAIGGWLKTVGSRMGPEDIVSSVFSEKQLRAIFEQGSRAG